MASFEYKVVPFEGRIKSGQAVNEVSIQLQSAIAQYAVGGWEFYQLDEVDIAVEPGCLAGFLGAKVSYASYNQLIFRKGS